MDQLLKMQKNTNDIKGLLNQLKIECEEKNILIMYNVFGFLNENLGLLDQIQQELKDILEIQKLNNEVPQ